MPTTMTKEEWTAEAKRRFGDNPDQWRFVCPSCGHVASVGDWKAADATSGSIAFSCIGRWVKGDDAKTFKKKGGPCQYAGGGLFKLNPITVIDEAGKEHRVFDFASPTPHRQAIQQENEK